MSKTIGPYRFIPRGDYNPAADPLYSLLDLVSDGGGSFVYINDTPSNEPTSSTSHWQQIATMGGQELVDKAVAARDAAAASASAVRRGQYGKIRLPADFGVTLPFDLYRDCDGLIKHNADFGKLYYSKAEVSIYVSDTGNDASGDGSSGNPYRTVAKAMAIILADGTHTKFLVSVSNAMMNREQTGITGTITGKEIYFRSTSPVGTIFSTNAVYSWTKSGATNAYYTARSGSGAVYDLVNTDICGLPRPLTKVATSALCESTPDSWYNDGTPGTTVWVHRADALVPTAQNTLLSIGVSNNINPTLGEGTVLYFENIIFNGAESQHACSFAGIVGSNATLILNNCSAIGYNRWHQPAAGNAFSIFNLKNAYLFNCIAAYAQLDGYNYHYPNVAAADRRNYFAFEYNCKAYQLGEITAGNGSCNASTCHEGAKILRIGTVGWEGTGANIIDINGCYSVLYDCASDNCFNSDRTVEGGGAGFIFDSQAPGYSGGDGKTYINNCVSTGCLNALQLHGSAHETIIRGFNYDGAIIEAGTITWD